MHFLGGKVSIACTMHNRHLMPNAEFVSAKISVSIVTMIQATQRCFIISSD